MARRAGLVDVGAVRGWCEGCGLWMGLEGGLGGGWEGLNICNFPQLGVGELLCPTSNGSSPWSIQRECTMSLNSFWGLIKFSW